MNPIRTILLLLFFGLLAAVSQAATYSVGDVPNVHLADRTRFLSDPDGIVGAAARAQVDSLMQSIRTQTSAEAVVVAVGDIDTDPDTFATELFQLWGLGKKDKDNGLLVLIVKDRRKAVIRTGYGLEGVLPAALCGRIIRHTMAPEFRNGDYDTGIVRASEQINTLLTDTEAAEYIRSQLADADRGRSTGIFTYWLIFSGVAAVLMLVMLIVRVNSLGKKDRFEKYRALESWRAPYLALSFLGIGLPLIATLPLVLLLQHWRNGRHDCPNCGRRMKKVDEEHDNDYLTPAQDLEEKIGSVDYDVWLCPSCGETDILPYVIKASPMIECANCHARTARMLRSRILRQPTTQAEGVGVHEYSCLNCKHITTRPFTLPKVAPVVILPLGGGGRGGFGGGGGSFGGGFGGGSTGGGGASGGW